ncbi:hypothetical protein MNB_SV-3-1314 [hydrothermal vent metagenome]|uniref:Uncharacterized protein n=1 Tax=hydrothermal vent metagenome TaxID=652676 RepID=A0A1W1CRY4_9ZZZZ
MERMTIKAYAVKHKLSIFNVMKMVRSGELKSITEEENGKEHIYILPDDRQKEVTKTVVEDDEKDIKGLNEALRLLKYEVATLKKEIERLKER